MAQYTDFSLEDVQGGEEFLRHQTFIEVQCDLQKKLLESIALNAMKEAYDEIVENGVDEFKDYQSAEVVGPTNKARETIFKVIPAFGSILGCISPTETKDVGIDFYALAGGKAGLYLVCDIKGLRDVTYRYKYPEVIAEKSDDDEVITNTVNYTFSTAGCAVTCIETHQDSGEVGSISYPAADSTLCWKNTVKKGTYITYQVTPDTTYAFVSMSIDNNVYTSIKDINDIPGITVAETSGGYEVTVTATAEDHVFEFVCNYNNTIITHDITVHGFKCAGSIYKNSDRLIFGVPDDVTYSFTHGDECAVYFRPGICTHIASIVIDGRDYYDEYIEGRMFQYHGRTADAMEFTISIDNNSNIAIRIPSVCMDHSISVEYADDSYNVKGIIVSPMGIQLEKFLDYNMTYSDSYETTALYTVLENYKDYEYSSMVVRDAEGKVLSSDIIDVKYYDISSRLTISKVMSDAVICIILTEKPKTCVITGECVHAGVQYMIEGNTTSVRSITTDPILYGNSAIFRIVADTDYQFIDDSPTFGADIKIDGKDVDNAELCDKNIELVRISSSAIMIGFTLLNGDHTFRVAMTEDNLKPKHKVTFEGTRVINKDLNEEDTDAVASFEGYVNEDASISRIYIPRTNYQFPDELTTNDVVIKVNDINVSHISAIPAVVGNAKVASSYADGELVITLSEVTEDAVVDVILNEENKVPNYYEVKIVPTDCTVNNVAQTYVKSVIENGTAVFEVEPTPGNEIPVLDDGSVDLDRIKLTVNGTIIDADSWPTNLGMEYAEDDDALSFTLTNVDKNYIIGIQLEYPSVEYNLSVMTSGCTVDNKSYYQTTIDEGGVGLFVIRPTTGKTIPDVNGIVDGTRLNTIINGTEYKLNKLPEGVTAVYSAELQTITYTVRNVESDYVIAITMTYPEEFNFSVSTMGCRVDGADVIVAKVLEGTDKSFVISPSEGNTIPTVGDNVDNSAITLSINEGDYTLETLPDKVSYVFNKSAGTITFTVEDVNEEYDIHIEVTYPVYHTVKVVATYATVEGDNPITVEDGEDKTIVLHADQGTTFENVMFILDKDTDNQKSWVIDMNKDSFNIFDKEVEGVPQIENDGTIVRSRDDDHYDYTINLKNIENDYEIRFSTVTIGV